MQSFVQSVLKLMRPSLRVPALALFFCWFAVTLVYYGGHTYIYKHTHVYTYTYVYTYVEWRSMTLMYSRVWVGGSAHCDGVQSWRQ